MWHVKQFCTIGKSLFLLLTNKLIRSVLKCIYLYSENVLGAVCAAARYRRSLAVAYFTLCPLSYTPAKIVGWMQNKKKCPHSFEHGEVRTSFDQEVVVQLTGKQKESIVHKIFIEERSQIVMKLKKETERKRHHNY
jgi:hypothetical protein